MKKPLSKTHTLDPTNPSLDNDYLDAVSYTECTGMIPSVTRSDEDAERYNEVVRYLPPTPPSSKNTDTARHYSE